MADLSATSSLYLNEAETSRNDGRPVYDVCRIGTRDLVGRVSLGADDLWRIVGAELDSWPLAADAVRMVMTQAQEAT